MLMRPFVNACISQITIEMRIVENSEDIMLSMAGLAKAERVLKLF
jgi:hypothetical protein